MLLLTEDQAYKARVEECRELGKDMIENIKNIAGIYRKTLKLDEFWIMLTGKPDMFTGKLNVAIRAFDKKNKPEFPLIASQMWHIKWSSGLVELEWILPLKKKGEHYTKGNKLIKDSLARAENVLGQRLVSDEDH